MASRSAQHLPPRRWPRRLAIVAAAALLLLVPGWFLLTDSRPSIPDRPPPTAEQVGAGREALHQMRAQRGTGAPSVIDFGPNELDGISALVSHGFRPDRLLVGIDGDTAFLRGSHRLPGGRWLNAGLSTVGGRPGFPPLRLTVGPVTLGPWLSRKALQAARILAHLRHITIPPLETMASDVRIADGHVFAAVSLPSRTGMVDELAATAPEHIDGRLVASIYCDLGARQRARPTTSFTELLHRAYAVPDHGAATVDYNRAASIALAMLVVDERAGDLADTARADSQRCRTAPLPAEIYGRGDWPKHWTLSAALAVAAGTQLSEAMGEWKELADSLDRQSGYSDADPTGFSFADLSADRSGFRVARALTDPDRAVATATWLGTVTPEQLLPRTLTLREDGVTGADFKRRYGGLSDPRFKARVAEIDRTLDAAGVPN